MELTFSNLPAQTQDVKQLKLAQHEASAMISQAIRETCDATSPASVAAFGAYKQTVDQLIAALGNDDVPCHQVDMRLFDDFSDCYKEEYKSRPRGFFNRSQVIAWMKTHGYDHD